MRGSSLGCCMVVAALYAAGCGRSAGPGSGSGGPMNPGGDSATGIREIDDFAGAMASIGTRVRVGGTAQNDKLSAVVEGKGLAGFCLDLEGWPADPGGKPAALQGTLERSDQVARPPPARPSHHG